jgi:prolipoprotein diacylglyceryl transferase
MSAPRELAGSLLMSPLAPVAFIPSPSHGIIHIGPIPLHAYGLMLAVGVLVAVRLSEPRAVARGFAPGTIAQIGTWVVVGGVLGARVYHLFTGYSWSDRGFWGIFEIWRGGLSIWGAVGGGVLGMWIAARRHHLDLVLLTDAVGPAVAVAQAIGRWGNWFNQELFGRPTTLPWGLEIDKAHRPAGYTQYATFQPTFLYESIWCLLVFVIVVRAEKRWRFVRGQSFALYVALYTFERTFMEMLRIDDATKIFGLRFNALLSAVICVVATFCFVRLARKPRPSASPSSPISDEPTSLPS